MSPKTPSPMIATLLILGGTVFGALGALHAVYTLLDLHSPRRLLDGDPSVAHAMAGFRIKMLPVGIIMPALTLIGCAYEVLALLYWFRFPAIGVGIGTACFAAAWVLSLR
jgi:hypothetical protein